MVLAYGRVFGDIRLGEVTEGEVAVLVLADAHFLGRPTWSPEPVLEGQLHVHML